MEAIMDLLGQHDPADGSRVSASTSGQEGRTPAQTGLRVVTAVLASLALTAVWGLAAGSLSMGLALANVYKVPMVVLLSALSAVPPALLAWFLLEVRGRPMELIEAHARGLLWGGLMLGALSPLLARSSTTV